MAKVNWRPAPSAVERTAADARSKAQDIARERVRATDPRTLRTVADLAAYVHDMAVERGYRAP